MAKSFASDSTGRLGTDPAKGQSGESEKNVVEPALCKVIALMQPGDLRQVVRRAEDGVGKQEKFEGDKKGDAAGQQDQAYVEVVELVGIHNAFGCAHVSLFG